MGQDLKGSAKNMLLVSMYTVFWGVFIFFNRVLCNEGVWFFFEIWSQHSPYATTNLGILLHKMQYPSSC